VRRHAKAPSATTGSAARTRASRTVFGIACACVLGLAVLLGSSAPPAGAVEAFPGQGFLPDNRAWEMVSPAEKSGGEVEIQQTRTHAAADCATDCAITFLSRSGFGDAHGVSVGTEYMAVRDPDSGSNGWVTHGITPAQEPLTFTAVVSGGEGHYVDELSPDLSMGLFRSFSPLTDDPFVGNALNLYARRDLREPVEGTYELHTACPGCELTDTPLPIWNQNPFNRPDVGGHSDDFKHVLFESQEDLTGDGAGVPKAYQSDEGQLRLVGVIPPGIATACGAGGPTCVLPEESQGASVTGLGASGRLVSRALSGDGTRASFSAPVTEGGFIRTFGPESSLSHVYQRDSHGTASTADDTTVKLDASERVVPLPSRHSVYQTASTDGSRVFFFTTTALTDETPDRFVARLYMWSRDDLNDEVQKLSVYATAGQFKLLLGAEETGSLPYDASPAEVETAIEGLPAVAGSGGDVEVTGGPGDETGSLPYTIAFGGGMAEEDIPTMDADRSALSGPTSAVTDAREIAVSADTGTYTLTFDGQTTAPIAPSASATEVEAALNALSSIGAAGGSVTVTGGPGNCCGSFPYVIEFGGSLTGEDASSISIDDSALDGSVGRRGGLTVRAGAGTYTLTFSGQTTSPVAFDAEAVEVEAALNGLSSIGGAGGSVSVSGGPGNATGSQRYRISFGGALEGEAPSNIVPTADQLEGGAAIVDPYVKGGGHLTLVDVDREPVDDPGSVGGVLGASEDGSHVYFMAPGQLVAGEPASSASESPNLYHWHEGEIDYIGRFTGSGEWDDNSLAWGGTGFQWGYGMIESRVAPDGEHVLFSARGGDGFPTDAFPSGYEHGKECEGTSASCVAFYVYDAVEKDLQCASCDPSDATSTVSTLPNVEIGGTLRTAHQSYSLSDDGRFVFFSTREALVPEDVNGRVDAYRYNTASEEASLLSSGFSSSDSYFMDASADGRDVFIITKERLSGWDVDTGWDLYDARIGGGLAEPLPPPPSCEGDACQPPVPALNDPTPASASFDRRGDVGARVRRQACSKANKRAKRNGGKSRCVKKKAGGKRAAKNNRRAGR
jgi:hypothetical protein